MDELVFEGSLGKIMNKNVNPWSLPIKELKELLKNSNIKIKGKLKKGDYVKQIFENSEITWSKDTPQHIRQRFQACKSLNIP